MAVRAAGLDGDHVAYYTLTWSWLRDDANYTKHAFSKKKRVLPYDLSEVTL